MTVQELIDLLKTFPPDAPVIQTMFSDYCDMEAKEITLIEPKDGEGIIRHHGHLMRLKKGWWEGQSRYGTFDEINRNASPKLLTVVHFAGN